MKTEELYLATIEGLLAVGQRYVTLILRAPPEAPPHAPGQYTQLEFADELGTFRKFYSIASAARVDRCFDLCLLLDDPRLKQWVQRQTLGSVVHFARPQGRFFVPPLERRVLMLAGGSGVTPLRAILEARLLQGMDSAPAVLLFGCQNDLEIPFYEQLLALEARFGERVRVRIFAEEVRAARASHGRPLAVLQQHIAAQQEYLLCGPPAFMHAAQRALEEAGIAAQHIHQDRF